MCNEGSGVHYLGITWSASEYLVASLQDNTSHDDNPNPSLFAVRKI